MESITEKALPQLKDDSDPSKIEDDWVTNFFDKSRIVSDDEMQNIWAKVLAGEANIPGTYSRKTINILGDIDRHYAELFQNLCSYACTINSDITVPLIFDSSAEIYKNKGIYFSSLSDLESIGLVRFETQTPDIFQSILKKQTGIFATDMPKNFSVRYFEYTIFLEMPEEDKSLPVGKVMLTKSGRQLLSACEVSEVDGFIDFVKEQWKQFLQN